MKSGKRVIRKPRISVASIFTKQNTHESLVVDRCFAEVISHESKRMSEMNLEFPVLVEVRPERERPSAT